MCLPVPGKVTGRAVTFPTIRTLALLVGRFLRLCRLLLQKYLVVVTIFVVSFFLYEEKRIVKTRRSLDINGGSRIFFFFWGGRLKNVFPRDIFYNIAVSD
jgi:uncharacterized membrane protein YphA (DoxX/SURF4 family)